MTTDIVALLRGLALDVQDEHLALVLARAADEIEELRRRVAQLEAGDAQ